MALQCGPVHAPLGSLGDTKLPQRARRDTASRCVQQGTQSDRVRAQGGACMRMRCRQPCTQSGLLFRAPFAALALHYLQCCRHRSASRASACVGRCLHKNAPEAGLQRTTHKGRRPPPHALHLIIKHVHAQGCACMRTRIKQPCSVRRTTGAACLHMLFSPFTISVPEPAMSASFSNALPAYLHAFAQSSFRSF